MYLLLTEQSIHYSARELKYSDEYSDHYDPLDQGTNISEDQQIYQVNEEEQEEDELMSEDKELSYIEIESVRNSTQPVIIKLLTSSDPILR